MKNFEEWRERFHKIIVHSSEYQDSLQGDKTKYNAELKAIMRDVNIVIEKKRTIGAIPEIEETKTKKEKTKASSGQKTGEKLRIEGKITPLNIDKIIRKETKTSKTELILNKKEFRQALQVQGDSRRMSMQPQSEIKSSREKEKVVFSPEMTSTPSKLTSSMNVFQKQDSARGKKTVTRINK